MGGLLNVRPSFEEMIRVCEEAIAEDPSEWDAVAPYVHRVLTMVIDILGEASAEEEETH